MPDPTLIVNFLAGPGAGKSTMAAAVFAACKLRGLNAELITEYAKDRVWEEAYRTLQNPVYVFAKQQHRMWRVYGKVDVLVTDSPLILSLWYGREYSEAFRALVIEESTRMPTVTFLLRRVKPYVPAGRVQTEAEAQQIDAAVERLLIENGLAYETVPGDVQAVDHCVARIQQRLRA